MIGRLVGLLVIAFSLVIQVFALTALFDVFELFDTAWREPFYSLGQIYGMVIIAVGKGLTGAVGHLTGAVPSIGNVLSKITLPCWWVHALAVYLGASLGVWGGSLAIGGRKLQVNPFARGGLSIAWPAAFASMIVRGIRNRPVSSFVSHHSGVSAFYGIVALASYAFANWANVNLLTGDPVPGQEISIINETPCPVPRHNQGGEDVSLLLSGLLAAR